jgi:sodium transport system ATP-binding protein
VIVFNNLSKRYGEVTAVAGLSLQVARGEVYALLGANGAGKTTALRCLATLLRPTSGSSTVDGYSSSSAPLEVRRRLGFLAASMGLYERLTAAELLDYFAGLQGLGASVRKSRVEELIEAFELSAFAHRRCGTLSTGQRQRVSIARAIVHDPPALVLDEPTLGLDVLSGETIYRFVAEARKRMRAILFSTHQMSEVELLADRVGILAAGRLVAEGTIPEILDQSGEATLSRAFITLARSAS